MKKLIAILSIALLVFVSCEKEDPKPEFKEDPSDNAGNLLIMNNSSLRLALYKDGVRLRYISHSSSDYLVNIPNPQEDAIELELYDYEDVKDDPNNPPIDKVFKKWKVPLSNSTETARQVTWHVGPKSEKSNSGTLKLKYYAGTDFYVDVHLNGQTGAKVATLKGGDQDKTVGLDYGAYTLAYHYWESDPNTADGVKYVGWTEDITIDDEQVKFWIILNDGAQEFTSVVTHMGTDAGQVAYGKLLVKNDKHEPIQIWANGKLIEEVCYLRDGNVDALSIINMSGSYSYILPMTPESAESTEYTVKATNLSGGFIVEENIAVYADSTVSWAVQ